MLRTKLAMCHSSVIAADAAAAADDDDNDDVRIRWKDFTTS